MNIFSASLRLYGVILFLAFLASAQIPAPKDTLGFTPGDDRKLASWSSIVDYFKKLDAASDRMIFEEIGKTTMGAPFVYATISSPENLKNLDKYREMNAELADPRRLQRRRGLPETYADYRIKNGKTIVLITCGIHSTEVGSTLSSTLIAHRLASSDDPEIKKILDNTIILLVPSLNPDGVDIVKNWYDKTLGTPYEGTEPPELYHKYVGHDNNRDWYAFTQVETQLTVDKIHNVWHPQIVHDIHQQGQNGARLFLPPYMQPVEPNVPKQIVEGYTELGNAMAVDLRKRGLEGITTNTTYDAWTPARAYSHYHGGVRILSETASARLATPITVKFEDLRGSSGGLDAKVASPNFGPVWRGGEWKLRNITDYMTTAAFSLLNHAADNRERWLTRFYEIGKGSGSELGEFAGFILPNWPNAKQRGEIIPDQFYSGYRARLEYLVRLLQRGGVEVKRVKKFRLGETEFPDGTAVISADQPYIGFANALLQPQVYPDLKDDKENPITPYDVTAHTLPLLMNVEVIPVIYSLPPTETYSSGFGGTGGCGNPPTYLIYKSEVPSMDEGWTRWIVQPKNGFASSCSEFESLNDSKLRSNLIPHSKAIIFPDQSPNQILNGHAKGSMPDEYTGGVGKEGVENLKKFVEAGGTLVFLNRASNFAIEQFNLPVKDVTHGLARKDFYIPGSILRTELDLTHPIAKGMPQQSIAWFEQSPAFEIEASRVSSPTVREGLPAVTEALTDVRATDTPGIRVIAKYPSDPKQILLSGWALGAEKIAGKAALVEFTIGKGKIVLFGFRPQYRGQSLATFPLLFNAISN